MTISRKIEGVEESEESEDEPIFETFKFNVNVLKVPDQEIHCVEGVILQGEKFGFSDEFNKMKAFFGGHADTSLPVSED